MRIVAARTRFAGCWRNLRSQAPTPYLITHKPNILDALGKDWFDVKEGEASIFHPKDGTFVLITRLQMADWPRIAMTAKQ